MCLHARVCVSVRICVFVCVRECVCLCTRVNAQAHLYAGPHPGVQRNMEQVSVKVALVRQKAHIFYHAGALYISHTAIDRDVMLERTDKAKRGWKSKKLGSDLEVISVLTRK